jgi:hypothetical protein
LEGFDFSEFVLIHFLFLATQQITSFAFCKTRTLLGYDCQEANLTTQERLVS